MQGQPVSVNISINQSNQNGSLPLGAQVILKMNDAITMNSVGKTPFFYYFMSVRINLFDKRLIVREFRFLTHWTSRNSQWIDPNCPPFYVGKNGVLLFVM